MAYTVLVFWLLEWIVEPRFFNRQRFSSLLLVILLIAFIEGLGLFGLIIGPPVAVAVQILFSRLIQDRLSVAGGASALTLAELEQRVAQLEEQLAAQESPASPKLLDMLGRLKSLMAEAARQPDAPATVELL
jgi:predicted PurR-regulated permease PerM